MVSLSLSLLWMMKISRGSYTVQRFFLSQKLDRTRVPYFDWNLNSLHLKLFSDHVIVLLTGFWEYNTKQMQLRTWYTASVGNSLFINILRQKARRILEYFQLTIEVSKMVTGSQKTYIVTLNLKFRQYVDKKELMRQPALGRSVLVENDQWRKQWHGLFHENGAQNTNKTLIILTIFDRS